MENVYLEDIVIKKTFCIGLLLFSSSTFGENRPSDMADVVGHKVNYAGAPWYYRFGHVAMYDKSSNRVLEVTNHYPAIGESRVGKIMSSGQYWGARHDKGSDREHYQIISYGNAQKSYSPRYTFSPYYREGGWVQKWKFSWRKGWYKKWVKESAKFRCDSFVNYCYKKATGEGLVRYKWMTTPNRIFNSLPYKR